MKTKWNLNLLYKNISDPNIDKDIKRSIKEVNEFVKKWKTNKEYIKEPNTLYIALREFEKLSEDPGICTKPSYYIFLQRALDQENPKLKAKENKLHDISLELENSIQFFLLNISKISKSKQNAFLNYPKLEIYKHFLQHLFNVSKYTLSDKEEKIFNLKSKTSYGNWVDMISELLSKQMFNVKNEEGKMIEVSYNEVGKYLNSQKKDVREYAAEEFYKINERYAEIAEFEINSILENKKINDTYRKIKRVDTERLLDNDIEEEVVDTLREVVTKNFDISKRYYKLKAKILKQNKLAYFERGVPIGDIAKKFTFEKSFEIVRNTFGKLDRHFEDILNKYCSEGRYDVYPKKGKDGGAFCISTGSKYPTYILLNHNEKLQDILTIAHESGHAIHSEYSNKQNPLNQGHSTATAEVASTFFEDFVLSDVKDEFSKKEKTSLMLKKLEDDISSIFRQIACYNFELELHNSFRKEGYLSKERISEIFCKEMNKYLGDSVSIDKHMELGWLYWSHIRSFFYTYSYASGLLISKYLQNIVREDKRNINMVKEFLKAGNSKSPKDIFKDLNVDITKKEFWIRSLDESRKQLEELESIYS